MIQCCYIWTHVNSFTWVVESARAYIQNTGGYSKLRPTHSIRSPPTPPPPPPIHPYEQQIKIFSSVSKSFNKMIIWWRFWGLRVELSTGWRVWMILLVPVTSPSLWPHWRAFSQATAKSYFSNECWCFWIEHGMVIFHCSDHLSGLPHYDGWQQLKCHLTETERVEKVNSLHFPSSHSRWDPVIANLQLNPGAFSKYASNK